MKKSNVIIFLSCIFGLGSILNGLYTIDRNNIMIMVVLCLTVPLIIQLFYFIKYIINTYRHFKMLDGFIKNPGVAPVKDGTVIDVLYNSGEINYGVIVGQSNTGSIPHLNANSWRLDVDLPDSIIGWRYSPVSNHWTNSWIRFISCDTVDDFNDITIPANSYVAYDYDSTIIKCCKTKDEARDALVEYNAIRKYKENEFNGTNLHKHV